MFATMWSRVPSPVAASHLCKMSIIGDIICEKILVEEKETKLIIVEILREG